MHSNRQTKSLDGNSIRADNREDIVGNKGDINLLQDDIGKLKEVVTTAIKKYRISEQENTEIKQKMNGIVRKEYE